MRKTTNISPDKSGTLKEFKKIKFDLNPQNYKCFISNNKKLSVRMDAATPQRLCSENPECNSDSQRESTLSQLRIPYIRRSGTINPCSHCQQLFNNQVLFMQYDCNQLYTDSIKTSSEHETDLDNKSVYSENSEQNQIVVSCLKMLTQETDTEIDSIQESKPQQPTYYSQSPNYYPGFKNQSSQINSFTISLPKISEDGRTTVMIRNIPNKYTQSLLLDLFNKSYKKKIDFFYLPIDYNNNCNVGYAFMNFIHPKFIEDFYNEFHNKKWKLFNSEKVCHICYARIQGTSQLSHHFESTKKLKEGFK